MSFVWGGSMSLLLTMLPLTLAKAELVPCRYSEIFAEKNDSMTIYFYIAFYLND